MIVNRKLGPKIAVSLLLITFGGFAFAQDAKPKTIMKAEVATEKVATSVVNDVNGLDIKSVSKSMNDKVTDLSGSRFAFITDEKEPKVAIFDTVAIREVTTLRLETTAEFIGVNKTASQLVYAKGGESKIYKLGLKKQAKTHVVVDAPIIDLAVLRDGDWVAYAHKSGAVAQSLTSGSKKVKVATDGDVSLLFHPNGKYLFVAELSRGRLQRVTLDTQVVDTLFDLGKAMSPISLMPNGIALFFVAGGQLQRYSLLGGNRTTLGYSVASFRPYMTSDSRVVIALTDKPKRELLVISAYTYKIKSRVALNDWHLPEHHDDFLVTGWLEQFALVAGSRDLSRLSLTEGDAQVNSQTEQIEKTAYAQTRDMFVQSDSKTVLLTQEGQSMLGVFDVRENALKKSRLSIKRPNLIIMTDSNMLCH